jgi:shikimate dehydrogenase
MDEYGLLGYPLSHSFSAGYFADKFAKNGIDACYSNFPLEKIEDFVQLLQTHPNLRGLNVTIPYKQAIIPFLDALDPEAKSIGAVNVIRFAREDSGKLTLVGYNSDLLGFRESIKPLIALLKKRLKADGKPVIKLKALILGTGGASKAVHYGLNQLNIDTMFVSRKQRTGVLTYEQLTDKHYRDYSIIVNTTPLGMSPVFEACPSINFAYITPDHLLYDLVYNPEMTCFLKRGAVNGALIKNGLEMLHGQAEAAWRIWNP